MILPFWGGEGGPQGAFKTSNEARQSNTAITADAVLKVPLIASRVVAFRFLVFYNTPGAADFKFDLHGPTSPTVLRYKVWLLVPAIASPALADYDFETTYDVVKTMVGTGTDGWLQIDGIVQNGANAGDLEFRWAQNTSTGSDTTVYAGSFVTYLST